MRIRGIIVVMMVVGFGLMTCLQGCETAKGLQIDAKNAYHHLSKIDDWMKKNMW